MKKENRIATAIILAIVAIVCLVFVIKEAVENRQSNPFEKVSDTIPNNELNYD